MMISRKVDFRYFEEQGDENSLEYFIEFSLRSR